MKSPVQASTGVSFLFGWGLTLILNIQGHITMVAACNNGTPGVKKSLVLEPGTSKISGRTSIYFHPMSGGQVKNSAQVYFNNNIFGQVN